MALGSSPVQRSMAGEAMALGSSPLQRGMASEAVTGALVLYERTCKCGRTCPLCEYPCFA
eukprot:scaffold176356_cov19-Tisochrysis_lutea.AAC.1